MVSGRSKSLQAPETDLICFIAADARAAPSPPPRSSCDPAIDRRAGSRPPSSPPPPTDQISSAPVCPREPVSTSSGVCLGYRAPWGDLRWGRTHKHKNGW